MGSNPTLPAICPVSLADRIIGYEPIDASSILARDANDTYSNLNYALGAVGRRFESCSPQHGEIAQWVEQRIICVVYLGLSSNWSVTPPFQGGDPGSSPGSPTKGVWTGSTPEHVLV